MQNVLHNREQDTQDRMRQDMQDSKAQLPYYDITEVILGSCFNVINELGAGFLESVYRNALLVAIEEKGLNIRTEKRFEVMFRGRKIGLYIPDLIVEGVVIIELKCCEQLKPEHQAQLINYLKVSGVAVGLLVNFGNRKLEYKRLYHPEYHTA